MVDLIVADGLCHEFRTEDGELLHALTNIALSVRKGEFLAIIGRNGSGKSTLARHFNALLLPTHGTCLVNGIDTRNHNNIWEIRQSVGMVFQNPDNQIVASVVEEDIAFGPENLGLPSLEIRSRVDEALEFVGMQDYRFHGAHLLSGGQKQRVAIAGVLAMRPECLVLDEPTAMLDPQGRKEVLSTVRRLNQREGITVVYITHFMEEAAQADRVLVMNQGSIVGEGTPAEIFSQTDWLSQLGLESSLAAETAERLRQLGLPIPNGIITSAALAEALCP